MNTGRTVMVRRRLVVSTAAVLLIALCAWVGFMTPACAIIQTGSLGVYQSEDGRLKIIKSLGENQGLFVALLRDPVSPQEFDPAALQDDPKKPHEGVAHLFIRFDGTAEYPYSEILIGEKRYKVGGNFSFLFGDGKHLRIDVDNNGPYLTLHYSPGGDAPDSLIGFYGITEAVNRSASDKGKKDLQLLRARPFDVKMTQSIKPYRFEGGQLFVGKKPIENMVGSFFKPKHPCLDAPSLTDEQLRQIQQLKNEVEQAKLLSSFLAKNSKDSPTRGTVLIKSEPNEPMVLLRVPATDERSVLSLKQIRSGTKTVCVLSPAG